jgi:hypothetical protein
MRRANAESTVHQKAIRTRHFPLKRRPNGHKRQPGNELRATSRATKAGRRDIEARSCQLSTLSRQRRKARVEVLEAIRKASQRRGQALRANDGRKVTSRSAGGRS